MKNIFKWRLRLVQKGYDLGWQHGFEAGIDEYQKQVIDFLNVKVENIDWLKEEPFTVRDVVPAIKEHIPDKEPVGWDK